MTTLSVLDLYPVTSGRTPSEAIRESVALARRVDELGYERLWIAEHHNMPGIAASAPEVLIGHVAQVTRHIRVGAGGVMLPNHAPLRVLEIFRTLEALYPGRIDLGIGRAPGTDPVTSSALRRASASDVNAQLAELVAFANKSFPSGHPYAEIEAMPNDVPLPPIWMLGSTSAGASLAAAMSVGFAFAGHFSMGEAEEAVATYRERFEPTPEMPSPRLMMAVSVVCGEDDARAEELARPLRVQFARMATGEKGPFPSVEEARGHVFTPHELAVVERFGKGAIIGGPERVRVGLEDVARRFAADELMISTVVPGDGERLASYERVARVWGLTPRA